MRCFWLAVKFAVALILCLIERRLLGWMFGWLFWFSILVGYLIVLFYSLIFIVCVFVMVCLFVIVVLWWLLFWFVWVIYFLLYVLFWLAIILSGLVGYVVLLIVEHILVSYLTYLACSFTVKDCFDFGLPYGRLCFVWVCFVL